MGTNSSFGRRSIYFGILRALSAVFREPVNPPTFFPNLLQPFLPSLVLHLLSPVGPPGSTPKGDLRHTGMTLGFRHDDGWFDILWRLCEDLEPLVAALEKQTERPFEILQVKEKVGGLRFHVNDADDAIRLRIEIAETRVFPHMRDLRATGRTAGS
jgi:hypothetical protein